MKSYSIQDHHFSVVGKHRIEQILVVTTPDCKDFDIDLDEAISHLARSIFNDMSIGNTELKAVERMLTNPSILELESYTWQVAISLLVVYMRKPKNFLTGIDFINTPFNPIENKIDLTILDSMGHLINSNKIR